MQANDRDTRIDDNAPRSGSVDADPEQTPVVRLLANPRRVRRA